jgi:hypothetical protein
VTDSYAQLLHRLTQSRTGDADAHAQASSRLAKETERVQALHDAAELERSRIIEAAGRLAAGVPDLLPSGQTQRPPEDLDRELAAAQQALAQAASARQQALRAGQLPTLLPRGHHFVRNLIVYGVAMLACLLTQFVLAFVVPPDASLWLAFIVPVLFLLAGYIATGIAGTPRIPMCDERGNPVEFRVYKSPRLGVALTVATIAVHLFVTADWPAAVLGN